jgi:hypothetical protein
VVVVLAWLTVRLNTFELTGEVLSLSTLADMIAVPAAVAWKLPVAVPEDWTLLWVLERFPLVAAQVTLRPMINAKSISDTGLPAESLRKLAFSEVDWLVTSGDVLAVSWFRYQGVKFSVPPAVVAVSHGVAPGPVLHPHQFSVTVAVAASTLL